MIMYSLFQSRTKMKCLAIIIISALLGLSSCKQHTSPDQLLNSKASLPGSFRLSELHQTVITSFMNKKDSTMSILYGNELGLGDAGKELRYSAPNASFTLVTWHQQADPHWFGARIPGELISAETLTTGNSDNDELAKYQKYAGKNLVKLADTSGRAARIHFILAQKPSIIP